MVHSDAVMLDDFWDPIVQPTPLPPSPLPPPPFNFIANFDVLFLEMKCRPGPIGPTPVIGAVCYVLNNSAEWY